MTTTRLYGVRNKTAKAVRLVDATSGPVARNHVVNEQFEYWLPTGREVAQIMADGAEVEVAGVPAEQSSIEQEQS